MFTPFFAVRGSELGRALVVIEGMRFREGYLPRADAIDTDVEARGHLISAK